MSYKRALKPIVKLSFIVIIVYTAVYGSILGLRIVLAVESPIMVVEGISMNPKLYDGDILIVQGVANKSQIDVGNIIIFHEWGNWDKLIVHTVVARYIKNGQLYFQTQGENRQTNPIPDHEIPETNVVGVLLSRIPVPIVGSIILFTQTLIGRLVLIISTAFVVIDMFYSKDDKSFIKEKS